jgi:nitrate reductase NapAB chaperone NapD
MNTTKWVVALVVAGALIVPAVARAHEGHVHKVMGTITTVEGNTVNVKTTAGKIVMVMLDAKTSITRGKTKLGVADVKVGDRVAAQGLEEKQMIMATSMKLGAAPVTAAKKLPATAAKRSR